MKKLIFSLATAFALISCAQPDSSIPTNKKDIMDQFLAGTLDPSYVPAAFFIHFGAGKTVGDAAVQAQLEYFLESNMDILKVQFEQVAPRLQGLDTPEGWDNVELMPEDFYRPTFEIINRLQEVAGKDVYILPTIYNQFQVARQSMGDRRMIEGFQNHPEALKKIFDSYKNALIWLIKECKKAGIQGFYTTTQGGEMKFNDYPGFFDQFIKPYDLEIMGEANKGTKMNILHICDWEGAFEDLTRFADYPGQIVNTPIDLNGTEFTMQDGYELFKRPVLGGLNKSKEIINASEDELEKTVLDALRIAPQGKIMLGAECTVSAAPISNIHKAVYTAHHYGELK